MFPNTFLWFTKGETIITFAFDWCGQMGTIRKQSVTQVTSVVQIH